MHDTKLFECIRVAVVQTEFQVFQLSNLSNSFDGRRIENGNAVQLEQAMFNLSKRRLQVTVNNLFQARAPSASFQPEASRSFN